MEKDLKRDLTKTQKIVREAALKGGECLTKYWKKLSQLGKKGEGDLVTIADQESEAAILKVLMSHFPEDTFLCEESGYVGGPQEREGFLWAIDPLDGTNNYAHGYSQFAISIGLLWKGEPILGAIYQPLPNLLAEGVLGQGAFCNEKPLKVSGVKTLHDSLFISGHFRNLDETNAATMERLSLGSHGLRISGSAAVNLVDVAMGHAEGFWYRGLKIWDIAAGALLVKEAGGKVSDYNNNLPDWHGGEIVATNGFVHEELREELRVN